MFAESPLGMAAAGSFGLVLLAAAAWDVRARRIPNALVACATLLGVGFAVAQLGVRNGLLLALSGFGVGLLIWLPPWLLGMIGAGDVKLFAAGAAWLGPMAALRASVFAALAGGVLAIGWIIDMRVESAVLARAHAGVGGSARNALPAGVLEAANPRPGDASFDRSLPYGVAVSIGLAVGAWLPHALR